MTDVLNVALRNEIGTRAVGRLRKAGQTPAVLYGHRQESLSLAIPTAQVRSAIRHGAQLVSLEGAVSEKALIREIQWDTFCTHVLHIDLTRVSEKERVSVRVPLVTRGESPGAKAGGIVEHVVFELDIECSAGAIPSKLEANLKELDIGGTITAGKVALPEGVELITAADVVVAHCVAAVVEAEEEEEEVAHPGAGEPEVIGRKPGESEEESS